MKRGNKSIMWDYKKGKINILVVEDNANITESFKYFLKMNGFMVSVASSKKQAISYIENYKFDMFLLDVQLPDGTGFELCRYIRSKLDKPIIFISAVAEETNIVYGLDMGADDYIAKPFGNSEVLSRIRCVLRRYMVKEGNSNIIKYKNIRVDIDKAKVYNECKEIFLTNLEYKILLMFLNNINKIITRDELLEKIWDVDGNFVNDNSLSVYIKRLRRKIANSDCKEGSLIQTVRGIGYILN